MPKKSSRGTMDQPQPEPTWYWPADLSALDVEFIGNELQFFAEDGTEAAEWLAFWASTEENKAVFDREVLAALLRGAENTIEETNEN